MPGPPTSPPPAVPIDRAALRLVLFGMPDAGKSSLLGALAQVAQAQPNVLQGRLADPSHRLAEQQQRLYEERPRDTLEEIVPYPVVYTPDPVARPEDSPSDWLDRIERRKTQVGDRFREFLARDGAAGAAPFGQIDLRLAAAAVKRPALAGSPAKPREPYGVAELFRQALESA